MRSKDFSSQVRILPDHFKLKLDPPEGPAGAFIVAAGLVVLRGSENCAARIKPHRAVSPAKPDGSASAHTVQHWKHNDMKKEGIIKHDSENDVWELN